MCVVDLPPSRKNIGDVGCYPITPNRIKADCQGFHGMTDTHDDQSLSGLTGVNFSMSAFLLNVLPGIKSAKIDLIEPDAVVLADIGFPQIKTEVEKKNAVFIMPPFAHDGQFTAEEVDETYNIASVRIHIERVNQRIKDFNTFSKVPISLLPYVDEIHNDFLWLCGHCWQ
ncbi:hypothetical protein WA026_019417 [Henosepilachna vigintioctopunctata]|uniref:DDE Tnp4 domain-containing protein n=1 Tax=Henosepilachna vigintioctopunctata TaxID=420089 RepID=A0AAW1U1Y1_9CUCU